MMKKLIYFALILILTAGITTSCKKKQGDPPVLPPVESMKIDFSNFTSGTKSAEIAGIENGVKGIENGNFTYAASVAGFWNLILTLNLVVPVASFAEAFNHDPEFIENSTWQWVYSVNVVGGTYKARLTGQIRANDVKWEMFVTKEGIGAFPEFMWFEGTSALSGDSGQWMLNHSAAFPEEFLKIDWVRENETVGDIKYTYVRAKKDDRSTDPANGSYIEYGLQNSTLNAFYNIHLYDAFVSQTFVDIFIEWSTSTHNGHVKAFHKYTDNLWHCWDSNGNDITCN